MTVTPEEEIYSSIKEMGYILATPVKRNPSFYRFVKDGTVMKIDVLVNHLIPDTRQPNGFNINSANMISFFIPKDRRRPESFTPYSAADLNRGVIDDDVEFIPLQENFTEYELSNNFILSLKAVLVQVKKTRFYNEIGEPVYMTNFNPIIKFKRK